MSSKRERNAMVKFVVGSGATRKSLVSDQLRLDAVSLGRCGAHRSRVAGSANRLLNGVLANIRIQCFNGNGLSFTGGLGRAGLLHSWHAAARSQQREESA